jgi:CTP:molybdopterin cytidylyltransferase MocA
MCNYRESKNAIQSKEIVMKFSRRDDPIDVVVLASGVNKIPLYEGYVPGYKALIPYNGRASIHYVLDALCAVKSVRRICIEGPVALLEKELANRSPDNRITLQEGGETFVDSLVLGLQHFRSSPAVLFAAADLPLMTPESVRDFLSGCADAPTEYEQNLYVSAVPKDSYSGAFTRFTKPFNRYRDVSLCHGNLFLADPTLLDRPDIRKRVNQMYAGRKTIKTALAFGWKVALTYVVGVELLHILTLRRMGEIASQQLGFGVVPVLVEHPEIAIDVDEPDDYQLVRERIEQQAERLILCT